MYKAVHLSNLKRLFKPQLWRWHWSGVVLVLAWLHLWMPLASAQDAAPKNLQTNTQPPKTLQTRGQTALVQEIVMGPQAYELWQKIQQLIENPELKDFSRLVQLFDLQIKEPMDTVNWQTMRGGSRQDIQGKQHNPMIKSGRYGIYAADSIRNYRQIFIEFQFDINQICLSKQEIQRLYQTTWEGTPTHSPNWNSQHNLGFFHNFGLKDHHSGFEISASGCALKFSANQKIEALKQEQTK